MVDRSSNSLKISDFINLYLALFDLLLTSSRKHLRPQLLIMAKLSKPDVQTTTCCCLSVCEIVAKLKHTKVSELMRGQQISTAWLRICLVLNHIIASRWIRACNYLTIRYKFKTSVCASYLKLWVEWWMVIMFVKSFRSAHSSSEVARCLTTHWLLELSSVHMLHLNKM